LGLAKCSNVFCLGFQIHLNQCNFGQGAFLALERKPLFEAIIVQRFDANVFSPVFKEEPQAGFLFTEEVVLLPELVKGPLQLDPCKLLLLKSFQLSLVELIKLSCLLDLGRLGAFVGLMLFFGRLDIGLLALKTFLEAFLLESQAISLLS
jgi:hypothetical protein